MGHWKNRWIQTPQRILMDSCIKQAPVLSKRFWIIPWPLAYNRLELDCIRKNNQFLIHFWMKMKSFREYLWLSNSCSYDVDDVIGRANRFEFQNFCSPVSHPIWVYFYQCIRSQVCDIRPTTKRLTWQKNDTTKGRQDWRTTQQKEDMTEEHDKRKTRQKNMTKGRHDTRTTWQKVYLVVLISWSIKFLARHSNVVSISCLSIFQVLYHYPLHYIYMTLKYI